MGEKSRGNFSPGWCGKTDCVNRDRKCPVCVRFSNYKSGKSNKRVSMSGKPCPDMAGLIGGVSFRRSMTF